MFISWFLKFRISNSKNSLLLNISVKITFWLIRKFRDLWLGIQNSWNHVLSKYLIFSMYIYLTQGCRPWGVPGVSRYPQILSDQLTLSQPRGWGQILPTIKYWQTPDFQTFLRSCNMFSRCEKYGWSEFSLEKSNCAASSRKWVNLPNVVRALFQIWNVHKWCLAILDDFRPTYLLYVSY